jgi:hypothetical protein
MVIKRTYFPHKTTYKEIWQSPDGQTSKQNDHMLVDGRHATSCKKLESCGLWLWRHAASIKVVRSLELWTVTLITTYRISQPTRRTFFTEKYDLNSTCVLCAKGKHYFQTYKYPYIYYTTSLSWDSEICFQIMRSGITACKRLTFLSGDLP